MPSSTYIQKRLVFLIIFIFLVNVLAMKFFWYHSFWWFDIPMHFLGGVWLGLAFMFLITIVPSDRAKRFFNIENAIGLIIFVFTIGFLWECFEIGLEHITLAKTVTPLDSLSDLAFDLAGGLVAYLRTTTVRKK